MDGAKGKILLVDDDADLVNLVTVRLEAYGFQVESCANGQELLQRVKRRRPDALVLDLEMPEKNGLAALFELKQVFGNLGRDAHLKGGLPVIVLTGLKVSELRAIIQNTGVYDYLEKPVDIQVLAEKLIQAVGAAV